LRGKSQGVRMSEDQPPACQSAYDYEWHLAGLGGSLVADSTSHFFNIVARRIISAHLLDCPQGCLLRSLHLNPSMFAGLPRPQQPASTQQLAGHWLQHRHQHTLVPEGIPCSRPHRARPQPLFPCSGRTGGEVRDMSLWCSVCLYACVHVCAAQG
jgi:hypothetical protein